MYSSGFNWKTNVGREVREKSGDPAFSALIWAKNDINDDLIALAGQPGPARDDNPPLNALNSECVGCSHKESNLQRNLVEPFLPS